MALVVKLDSLEAILRTLNYRPAAQAFNYLPASPNQILHNQCAVEKSVSLNIVNNQFSYPNRAFIFDDRSTVRIFFLE